MIYIKVQKYCLKILGLVVSDKKIFYVFPRKAYVKHVNPGVGNFWPLRSIIWTNLVEVH